MRLLLPPGLLLLLGACGGGGGGGGLAGRWSGELNVGDIGMPTEMTLRADGDDALGSGTLDCTDYAGSACSQTFDMEILQIEGDENDDGEQGLDVNVSNCTTTVGGSTDTSACTDPEDVYWDGADFVHGLWEGGEFTLERG